MHCHFELHISWGLRMAWFVFDGKLHNRKCHVRLPICPNVDDQCIPYLIFLILAVTSTKIFYHFHGLLDS